MRAIVLTTLIAVSGITPAIAQLAAVTSFPHQAPAGRQTTSYQGVGIASLTVDLASGGQPCLTGTITCPPAVDGGLAIGVPRYFFFGGVDVVATVLVEDTTYSGPCTVAISIAAAPASPSTQTASGSCQANTDYVFAIPLTTPVVSDPSVLATGSVTAGLILASNSTGTVVNGASVPIAIALRQETESPGIVGPTSITIGEETLGLPCNNCGPSSLAPDVALPIPVYVVSRNDNYNVTLLAESFNYAGPCTFEWTVKQGATTVAGSARPLTGGCLGTPLVTLYQTVWNLNLPEAVTPGPAVLAGAVIAGDHTYTVMQQILIH